MQQCFLIIILQHEYFICMLSKVSGYFQGHHCGRHIFVFYKKNYYNKRYNKKNYNYICGNKIDCYE